MRADSALLFRRGLQNLLLAGALTCMAWGCAHSPRPQPSPESLRERATNQFATATLLKPLEDPALGQALQFAPLLLHEVLLVGSSEASGHANATDAHPISLHSSGVTLYVDTDTVSIRERQHMRFTYVWFYPGNERRSGAGGQTRKSKQHRAATGAANDAGFGSVGILRDLMAQGVRITLDRHGQPAIWEVLSDDSGLRLFYVSASVEARAKAQFGTVLPERRFAVERAAAESPRAIVVRVLDDAGVPMGPIVYVSATGSHGVSTVLCRCMASQARELVSTGNYSLLPMSVARTVLGPEQWALSLGRETAAAAGGSSWSDEGDFWPAGNGVSSAGTSATSIVNSSAVEHMLRLPEDF